MHPLECPGSADLTASVNFALLKAAIMEAGVPGELNVTWMSLYVDRLQSKFQVLWLKANTLTEWDCSCACGVFWNKQRKKDNKTGSNRARCDLWTQVPRAWGGSTMRWQSLQSQGARGRKVSGHSLKGEYNKYVMYAVCM
jgi:hypothetical protein